MKFLLFLIILAVFFMFYVRFLEYSTVFLPSHDVMATPDVLGLPFEEIYFQTEDHVTLHGWFINASSVHETPQTFLPKVISRTEEEKKKIQNVTLLFLHGNAGNIADRVGKIEMFYHMGLNVFIIDYRGYGKSQGKPTEKGIYKDALAAYDYLMTRKDITQQKIVVYGASLGGAVAVDLALRRSLACLVVDSSFSSAADMARWAYPFVPSFFIETKLDSISKVKNIVIPKLFIHSIEDETVPIHLGQKLFQAAGEPKEFLQISGNHMEGHLQDPERFVNGIMNFLLKYLNN